MWKSRCRLRRHAYGKSAPPLVDWQIDRLAECCENDDRIFQSDNQSLNLPICQSANSNLQCWMYRCRHQLRRRSAAAAGRGRAVLAGGKVRVSDRRFLCGGQTATVMAACAALGLRCGYLGAFGSDEHGRLIRNALEELRRRRARLDRVRCAEPRRGHPRRSAGQPHGSLASQRPAEAAVRETAACRRCRRASSMSTTMILSWRCMPRRSPAAPALSSRAISSTCRIRSSS